MGLRLGHAQQSQKVEKRTITKNSKEMQVSGERGSTESTTASLFCITGRVRYTEKAIDSLTNRQLLCCLPSVPRLGGWCCRCVYCSVCVCCVCVPVLANGHFFFSCPALFFYICGDVGIRTHQHRTYCDRPSRRFDPRAIEQS